MQVTEWTNGEEEVVAEMQVALQRLIGFSLNRVRGVIENVNVPGPFSDLAARRRPCTTYERFRKPPC